MNRWKLCIKFGWWNNSILWCAVVKTSKRIFGVQYFRSKPTIEQHTLMYLVTLPLALLNFKHLLIFLNNKFDGLKSGNVSRTVLLKFDLSLQIEEHQPLQLIRRRLSVIESCNIKTGARGGVVVKALRYKPADPGFDSRWCHWNFSVT